MPDSGDQHSVCRLCSEALSTNDSASGQQQQCIDIFGTTGTAAKCSEIMFKHFGIKVFICDELSNRICLSCWSITDAFHNLYETVRQNETSLRLAGVSQTVDGDTKKEYIQSTEPAPRRRVSSTSPCEQASYKDELLETEEDGPVSRDVDIIIKSELPNTNNQDLNEISLLVEEGRNVKYGIDCDLIDEFNNYEDTDDNEDNGDDTNEPTDQAATGNKWRKRRSADDAECIERENALIRQYYSMKCILCSDIFSTINDAIKHYRRHHQQPGFLLCCGKKVYRRCMALDHIQKHIDPDRHRCAQCGKLYTNLSTLRWHMKQHKQVIESKEFECEQCSQRCETMQALAKHRRMEHNDVVSKEFGCDICGKFFVTKSVLGNHIRGVHENAFVHMCHICAKTFKSKQVFDLHQRQHLETEPPKLQCSICGNWLKHEHSLRKHMARHGQTAEVCKLCNKVAPNRHALGNHMRYVHSERSYKCTMCDKAFKKPIGLKEHMASHMGVDLYLCPYCPKTFKSNANMHSHRKKKHLTLWQQDRDQRQKP